MMICSKAFEHSGVARYYMCQLLEFIEDAVNDLTMGRLGGRTSVLSQLNILCGMVLSVLLFHGVVSRQGATFGVVAAGGV